MIQNANKKRMGCPVTDIAPAVSIIELDCSIASISEAQRYGSKTKIQN